MSRSSSWQLHPGCRPVCTSEQCNTLWQQISRRQSRSWTTPGVEALISTFHVIGQVEDLPVLVHCVSDLLDDLQLLLASYGWIVLLSFAIYSATVLSLLCNFVLERLDVCKCVAKEIVIFAKDSVL